VVPVNCGHAQAQLGAYLTHTLTQPAAARVRDHLDSCQACWAAWSAYRWERARSTPLYRDLAAFLGPLFRPGWDSSRTLALEWEHASPRTHQQAAGFFRGSLAYLHNLVIWEASGNRPGYLAAATPTLARLNARTVIDYGCGIGSDTLALRRLGYHVTPCDYDSPSTRFFAWRARRAGTDSRTTEPGKLSAGHCADTLWIIDTIDHLADPQESIGHLLATVRIIICERLTADRAHGQQGFHYRRPAAAITGLYASYGFQPAHLPSHDPIDCWIRHDSTTLGRRDQPGQ
jgi:hypothetical protein